MSIQKLGFTTELANWLKENSPADSVPGRVMQEHRERYVVSTGENEYNAEITGNLRFSASSRSDFPAVGDWVAMTVFDEMAIIHKVLPRKSVLERESVGKYGEKQIISANVDVAFIVQSIDNNFNINRLERYMTICYQSGIEPVFIISKIDLAAEKDLTEAVKTLELRHAGIKYLLLDNFSDESAGKVLGFMQPGMTYCVVGSSGVGKSTLINNLLSREVQKTGSISASTSKGKHVTEHRELFIMENGSIIIDTPGMRELGVADSLDGIKNTFREIYDLTLKCKFPDCTHQDEKGCAVAAALGEGTIDKASLENFRRMLRDQERFTATVAEKRKKEREFGKMIKEVLKVKKRLK